MAFFLSKMADEQFFKSIFLEACSVFNALQLGWRYKAPKAHFLIYSKTVAMATDLLDLPSHGLRSGTVALVNALLCRLLIYFVAFFLLLSSFFFQLSKEPCVSLTKCN